MSEKVIGIVGGMGPEATLDLYREILQATPAQKDQDHLRVIIDSNPKIPDRTPAITGAGASPMLTSREMPSVELTVRQPRSAGSKATKM